jgi:hypothetical protein
MGKLEQTIIKAYNSLGVFSEGIQKNTLLLVYGKSEELLLVDFSNKDEVAQYLKQLPKINKGPSLTSINTTLKVINNYDVCNPANFAINQLHTRYIR